MNRPHRRTLDIAAVDTAVGAVCNLPSSAERTIRAAGIRDLLREAVAFDESADGITVSFPPTEQAARSALEVVLAERRCCPRFRYRLTFTPGADTFALSVDATGELVEPLRTLYRTLATEAGINAC